MLCFGFPVLMCVCAPAHSCLPVHIQTFFLNHIYGVSWILVIYDLLVSWTTEVMLNICLGQLVNFKYGSPWRRLWKVLILCIVLVKSSDF